MGFYELRTEKCFRNPVWKKVNQDIYLLKDKEGSWIVQQNFTECGAHANSQIFFGTSASKCLPTKSEMFSLMNVVTSMFLHIKNYGTLLETFAAYIF